MDVFRIKEIRLAFIAGAGLQVRPRTLISSFFANKDVVYMHTLLILLGTFASCD